jgi:hypothetical protein
MLQDASARRSHPHARRCAPCRASRTEPPPYRTLRPASVCRSARCGHSHLCHTALLPLSALATHPRRAARPQAAPPYPGRRPRTSRPHYPCRDLDCFPSPWCAGQSLHRLELAYIRASPSFFARRSITKPPLPLPIGAHGEPNPPAACTANTCCSRLP